MHQYYDPMFYISSPQMPFTFRIEVTLKEPVQEASLQYAVSRAILRYPYYSVQVQERDSELHPVFNPRPIVVYPGPEIRPLGSEAVNGHLVAFCYEDCRIHFLASHALTDGGGFTHFIKTVLYYYLCHRHGLTLNADAIRLADEPPFADELGNPYPEDAVQNAIPYLADRDHPFFRLTDGGYVQDDRKTAFLLRLDAQELMRFNHDHDGSPCSLLSALMTKAIWELHPNEQQDIVSAVSFNLRPGLGNGHSYRLLCSALRLRFPNRLRTAPIARLCTCARGMTMLQSDPKNVLYLVKQQRACLDQVFALPTLSEKKQWLGQVALADSVANTFSISYVGDIGLGSLTPYLDTIYNFTDGSTYRSLFLEVSLTGGRFDIAFLQGFSSDIYYRAFLRQLAQCGLHYEPRGMVPLRTPQIELP